MNEERNFTACSESATKLTGRLTKRESSRNLAFRQHLNFNRSLFLCAVNACKFMTINFTIAFSVQRSDLLVSLSIPTLNYSV